MSTFHERLLLLKNATVNRNLGFDDVCKEKHAKIVYHNRVEVGSRGRKFVPDTNRLRNYGDIIKYPLNPRLKTIGNVAAYWELEDMFLKINKIKPEWIKIDYHYNFKQYNLTKQLTEHDYSLLNETTGQWSGAVGLIQRDQADYAVKNHIPSYNMSKVAVPSPTLYAPLHWVTNRREVSPIWNLFGLFTKVLLSLKCFNFVKNESKTKMIHAGCFPNVNPVITFDL